MRISVLIMIEPCFGFRAPLMTGVMERPSHFYFHFLVPSLCVRDIISERLHRDNNYDE